MESNYNNVAFVDGQVRMSKINVEAHSMVILDSKMNYSLKLGSEIAKKVKEEGCGSVRLAKDKMDGALTLVFLPEDQGKKFYLRNGKIEIYSKEVVSICEQVFNLKARVNYELRQTRAHYDGKEALAFRVVPKEDNIDFDCI